MIFADEPTGALDPTTGGQILRLLRDAVDRDGVTVVMVTHDPIAAEYSDRLVLLSGGMLVADLATPDAATIAARLRAVSAGGAAVPAVSVTLLLAPSPAERRIARLESSRAVLTADAATTLRRVERDLHDGTQARLVALGLTLSRIEQRVDRLPGDTDELTALLGSARGTVTDALAELRDIVRRIHPPALDDGLETALTTLAARSAVPVEVTDRPARAATGRDRHRGVLHRRRAADQRGAARRRGPGATGPDRGRPDWLTVGRRRPTAAPGRVRRRAPTGGTGTGLHRLDRLARRAPRRHVRRGQPGRRAATAVTDPAEG